jgi:hypothetical protein
MSGQRGITNSAWDGEREDDQSRGEHGAMPGLLAVRRRSIYAAIVSMSLGEAKFTRGNNRSKKRLSPYR